MQAAFAANGLAEAVHLLGHINGSDRLMVHNGNTVLLNESRLELQKAWRETSHQIQRLRDNPACADSEFALLSDDSRSTHTEGLTAQRSWDVGSYASRHPTVSFP